MEVKAMRCKNAVKKLEAKEEKLDLERRTLSRLREDYNAEVAKNSEIISRFAAMDPRRPSSSIVFERMVEVIQFDRNAIESAIEHTEFEKRTVKNQIEAETKNYNKEITKFRSDKKE